MLRYNRVPNRVLVELANLGNEEDRALVKTRTFRDSLAESLASAVVAFFGGPPPELYGPVPPSPSKVAPRPAGQPGAEEAAQETLRGTASTGFSAKCREDP